MSGVEGSDPETMHQSMAATLDLCFAKIRMIQTEWRIAGSEERPRFPMIVLRTPKGWTGPTEVDGHMVEGTWRAHQVPLLQVRENPTYMKQLEHWVRSYHPEKLFDAQDLFKKKTGFCRSCRFSSFSFYSD
jgi:xylulose-5-phosphate/fructose-6-phosphate phosphoketolase